MILAIVLVIYFAIICTDFRVVIKKKSKKVTIIYSTVLSITFCLMVITSLGIQIPSPSMMIKDVIISFMGG